MLFCVDNVDSYQRQRQMEGYAQMDGTKKEEIMKRKQESKSGSCNKENEVITQDDEWLSRNDSYQRQPIHVPEQEQEKTTSGMNAIS